MKCIIGRIMIIMGILGSVYMFYYIVNDTKSTYVSPFSEREVVVISILISFIIMFFVGVFLKFSCVNKKEKESIYSIRDEYGKTTINADKNDKPSFRGDLSLYGEDGKKLMPPEGNSKYNEDVSVDSSDAVIFLSFTNVRRVGWICSECGAANSNKISNCAVCGLQK